MAVESVFSSLAFKKFADASYAFVVLAEFVRQIVRRFDERARSRHHIFVPFSPILNVVVRDEPAPRIPRAIEVYVVVVRPAPRFSARHAAL